jgi:NAD(P)H dehydrogenase (quinone)
MKDLEGGISMRIAVTGATGHLGRLAVQGLLDMQPAGNIVVLVREATRAADLAAQGVQVRVATYDDAPALRAALAGVDKVLLVSSSEVGRRIQQHKNVIDAAKAAGMKHVVYTSAPNATTTALIVAPEHKATEEYLASSGLSYTIVRNNWYTENYLRQVEIARRTGTVVAAVGQGRVASASRADYAAGAVAVLLGAGHEGKIYEFSGDYAWDYNELASTISDIIGKPVTYQPVDAATLIGILKGAGMDEGTAGFVAALDNNIAAGLLSETSGELSALIGRPTTPLKDGLRVALG